eukprot:6487027-Amphidinium_carterae.1
MLDALVAGEVAKVGDIAAQRFKVLELVMSVESWDLAAHLEVSAPRSGLLTEREKELAIRSHQHHQWVSRGQSSKHSAVP